jgi:hypothetical protein
MSKAIAGTLANFNLDSRALPIAPVPTKPILSMVLPPRTEFSPSSRLGNNLVAYQRRPFLST